ncbi:MAG: histidinol phosphate phosphatase [Chloroflexi bacterium]|nr:histidinol phosphate phosphatase [Chloroflexota bacterium]MDL1940989.1 histidinol phosphate phosphatase [Chloroflexi bacterium CFX2]
MTSLNLQPYLEFAASLAYHAGKITLRYFNTGVKPDRKANNDPVTIADREAEAYVRAEVEKNYPGHAIVGEEYGENPPPSGGSAGGENGFRWIVDPIDGTISFIRGVPLYGVLIALEIEGVVKVGAAYFPPLDEMLTAADGLGCWCNGRRARVSKVSKLSEACVVTSDFQHLTARMNDIVHRFEQSNALLRTWGDAYGYLLVATGRAEVALDPRMDVYDCGPYPVIMKEAGGYFGSWGGEEGHTHGEGIACNAALKPEVLKLMR